MDAQRGKRIGRGGAALVAAVTLIAALLATAAVPMPGGAAPTAAPSQTGYPLYGLEEQEMRRSAYRACLRRAARHTRREIRRARRLSGRRLARARRHIKSHRTRMRRACVRAHGRTPGRVTELRAAAASRSRIVLRFRAAGTDGDKPPAAQTYLVKQSRRPIRSARAFRRAQTLCKGRCRFGEVTDVGGDLELSITDLRRRTTYYYSVAARDNATGKVGPRSSTVRARTR